MWFRRRSVADAAAEPETHKGPGRISRGYTRYMNSNRTYYGSMVFMVIVGLLGAYVVFWPTPTPGTPVAVTPVPAATTPVAAPTPTPNEAGWINGCAPQDSVDLAPEKVVMTTFDTDWKPIGRMSIPGSATGGPGVQDPPHCFTRTPEGALYSMATFIAERAQTTDNAGVVTVMDRRCFHDANYQAYSSKLLEDTPVTGQPEYGISGYRWMDYSPDRAQVELRFKLLSGANAGESTSNVFSVIWANNDWLILAPNPTEPTQVPGSNLRTFHAWGDTG